MRDHHDLGADPLGATTWTTVEARPGRTLVVPVGSCEQHGPHLPLDTDTRIAAAVAAAAVDRRRAEGDVDAVLAPALAYGASGEHAGFAGTLSIGTEVLTAVLVELGRSALPVPASTDDAFAHVVLVNGHGGNHDAVDGAVEVLAGEGRAVRSWSPRIPGGDAHAGRTETSLLLAIAPHVVGDERPVGATEPLADLLPALRLGGVAAVDAAGVLGDATGANEAEGRAILEALVADLAAVLAATRPAA